MSSANYLRLDESNITCLGEGPFDQYLHNTFTLMTALSESFPLDATHLYDPETFFDTLLNLRTSSLWCGSTLKQNYKSLDLPLN